MSVVGGHEFGAESRLSIRVERDTVRAMPIPPALDPADDRVVPSDAERGDGGGHGGTPAPATYPISDRNRIRRDDRASYERELVHAIFDEALICRVGFALDGVPYVIPMLHSRIGETIYVHGLPATRIIRHLRTGPEVCIETTVVDGLVMARSSFHHSLNYRSVVAFGRARLVRDPAEKRVALRAVVEHVAAGRWDDARQPSEAELRQTHVIAIDVATASAKVRTGPPKDDEADLGLPVWGGVIPVREAFGPPEPDEVNTVPVPPSLAAYRRPGR